MLEESGNLAEEIFGDDQAAEAAQEEKKDQGSDTEKPEEEDQKSEVDQRGQEREEKLLAGRFRSVEELEKAYREAEKWGTQRSQEVSTLRKELEELRKIVAPDMTKKQEEQWHKATQQAISAAVEGNPEQLLQLIDYIVEQRTEEKLQQRYKEITPIVESYRFQQQINDFFAKNPDAKEYTDDIARLINDVPELVTKPNWLDKAYAMVLKQKLGVTQKTKAEASVKTKAEKQAASMPGGTARKTQEPESEEEKIKKDIFGDLTQKRKIFDF